MNFLAWLRSGTIRCARDYLGGIIPLQLRDTNQPLMLPMSQIVIVGGCTLPLETGIWRFGTWCTPEQRVLDIKNGNPGFNHALINGPRTMKDF